VARIALLKFKTAISCTYAAAIKSPIKSPPPFFRAENGTNKMQKHGEPGPLRILFRKFHRLKLHRFNQQTGHAEQHSGKFLIA
jgi:hypothetical protein